MNDFVATHFDDLSRVWKASTAKRNADAWRSHLAPHFGELLVADVSKAEVIRWRDACAGEREARYNRALPVLASLLNYAEALKMRRKGSNPCRGMPHYKRHAMERYLTPREYARVGAELRAQEAEFPTQVAILRLLLFTGARRGEIEGLQWDWVKPPRLVLPDSKTGPKVIWLNSQALAILERIVRTEGCPYVFPNPSGTKPINLVPWWLKFRRRCALPDVRVHDLRHSFASTAIMDDVPLATIGKLLGHVLPETTAKYAHLADEIVADAASGFQARLPLRWECTDDSARPQTGGRGSTGAGWRGRQLHPHPERQTAHDDLAWDRAWVRHPPLCHRQERLHRADADGGQAADGDAGAGLGTDARAGYAGGADCARPCASWAGSRQ